jgi:hypothetical protein
MEISAISASLSRAHPRAGHTRVEPSQRGYENAALHLCHRRRVCDFVALSLPSLCCAILSGRRNPHDLQVFLHRQPFRQDVLRPANAPATAAYGPPKAAVLR